MKKIKKYFKWLTFLSAPLLATSSLFALTSCSSEEPNSGSSNSGGNNSGSNGGSNNSGKEIPKGKELLSDLVSNREVTSDGDNRSRVKFLILSNSEYDNVAWQYIDGTNIEYKVTIEVQGSYSIYSTSRIKKSNELLYASNIDGFKYSFSILKNQNTNKFEYKIPQNRDLKKSSYSNSVYFLPFKKQAMILNNASNYCSALSLNFEDTGYIYFDPTNGDIGNENIFKDFEKNVSLFSGKNGERYYNFNEDNIGLMSDRVPDFLDFKNLKGSINIEI